MTYNVSSGILNSTLQ